MMPTLPRWCKPALTLPAVISAVVSAPDPEAAARHLVAAMEAAR